MKLCPYCGKEYPDDAVQCSTDGYTLPQIVEDAPSARERENGPDQTLEPTGAAAVGKIPSNRQRSVTYPEYQWSARDGWKCMGMLLLIGFLLSAGRLALDRLFPPFHTWRLGPVGYLFTYFLHYILFLVTAVYFARTESFSSFVPGFGLDRQPSDYVWFGVV